MVAKVAGKLDQKGEGDGIRFGGTALRICLVYLSYACDVMAISLRFTLYNTAFSSHASASVRERGSEGWESEELIHRLP